MRVITMSAGLAIGSLGAALLLLAACGTKPADNGNAAAAGNESKIGNYAIAQSVSADVLPADANKLPIKEFMGHVMQFSAGNFWKWQGFVNDEKGERSLFPKTEQDWEDAESAGLTLAEITNILLLPGRRVADPRWDKAVALVRSVALKGAAAAEKHDKDALFAAGGELDEACESCHVNFVPNYVGPPTAPAAPAGKK